MDREIRDAAAAYFAEVEREATLNEEVRHLETRLQRMQQSEHAAAYNSSNERNLQLISRHHEIA